MNGKMPSYYAISTFLHALVVVGLLVSGRGARVIDFSKEQHDMAIDIVHMADEKIVTKQVSVRADEAGHKKKMGPSDMDIKGDTALLSKDNRVYSVPKFDSLVKDENAIVQKLEQAIRDKEGATEAAAAVDQHLTQVQKREIEEKKIAHEVQPMDAPNPLSAADGTTTQNVEKQAIVGKITDKDVAVATNAPSSLPAVAPSAMHKRKPADNNSVVVPAPKHRKKDANMDRVLQTVKQYRQESSKQQTGDQSKDNNGHQQASVDDNDSALAIYLVHHIQSKFIKCWDMPVAAQDSDFKVYIEAYLNVSGDVTDIRVLHGVDGDQAYAAIEDSAIRAVRQCSPLTGLPADKYQLWSKMVLVFDPKKSYQ